MSDHDFRVCACEDCSESTREIVDGEIMRTCGLCGHEITLDKCGSASTSMLSEEGAWFVIDLCHADDHSCYHRWTVYGERPQQEVSQGSS